MNKLILPTSGVSLLEVEQLYCKKELLFAWVRDLLKINHLPVPNFIDHPLEGMGSYAFEPPNLIHVSEYGTRREFLLLWLNYTAFCRGFRIDAEHEVERLWTEVRKKIPRGRSGSQLINSTIEHVFQPIARVLALDDRPHHEPVLLDPLDSSRDLDSCLSESKPLDQNEPELSDDLAESNQEPIAVPVRRSRRLQGGFANAVGQDSNVPRRGRSPTRRDSKPSRVRSKPAPSPKPVVGYKAVRQKRSVGKRSVSPKPRRSTRTVGKPSASPKQSNPRRSQRPAESRRSSSPKRSAPVGNPARPRARVTAMPSELRSFLAVASADQRWALVHRKSCALLEKKAVYKYLLAEPKKHCSKRGCLQCEQLDHLVVLAQHARIVRGIEPV